MNLGNGRSARVHINMAPMIDIIFLLLIFFLTTSQLIQSNVDHGLKLPEMASAERPESLGERLVLNLRADGSVVIGGRIAAMAEVRDAVAEAAEDAVGPPVVILRADRDVSCGRVLELGQVCRELGVEALEVRAEPAGGEPE